MPRYSFESSDEPVDDQPPSHPPPPPAPPLAQRYQSPPPRRPVALPDSTSDRLQAQRHDSGQNPSRSPPPQPAVSPVTPPPSLRQDSQGRYWGRELGYANTDSMASNVTRGADNFGEGAAGGIVGVARRVADQHARESGLEAMRQTPGYDPRLETRGAPGYDPRLQTGGYQDRNPQVEAQGYRDHAPRQDYSREAHGLYARDDESSRHTEMYGYDPARQEYELQTGLMRHENSHSSMSALSTASVPPAMAHAQHPRQLLDPFSDTPYQRYSRTLDTTSHDFDPNAIDDDGDDFGMNHSHHTRGSLQSLAHKSGQSTPRGAPAAATAAAAGGVMSSVGGIVGRVVSRGNQGPVYGQVSNPQAAFDEPDYHRAAEKSEWLNKQSSSKKRLKWIIAIIVAVLVLGAIGGGVGAYFVTRNTSSPSTTSGASASDDSAKNGDLDKNSAEIQALMNNKNLHKVFPGMDYTPMYTQYPDCLSYPASQNNVTRDIAVLSQLTNVVRLYGTDCNQTEMVLHSISNLGLTGSMKVWLGVWQDTNSTTNARQLAQMYDILKKYGTSSFLGVIVGNEILFREDMTASALTTLLATVKSNFTSLGYDIPVTTSDLGDKWTPTLAAAVDYVMANVHPFFTGKDVSEASAFTWEFWQNNNFILKPDLSKNYISETGWPSTGGTDCGGTATTCPGTGSVAGVTEMNKFMSDWICPALTNGTNYFWFEAFDEPWKIKFDTGVTNWEDHWGMMDVNRNLKAGVTIPDCGGKTVPNL